MLNYIKDLLNNQPVDWLNLTTHRLDIYNEDLAKVEFIEAFEELLKNNNSDREALSQLPTAYDYIRLGHPLSSILEWVVAEQNNTQANNVISFGSKTMPLLAILRKNSFENKKTRILYTNELPKSFDADIVKTVYAYDFHLEQIENTENISTFNCSTVFISRQDNISRFKLSDKIDFYINTHDDLGSIVLIDSEEADEYISEIQHVRRRESIAMTPANCDLALRQIVGESTPDNQTADQGKDKSSVLESIKNVTGTDTQALVASSGLSIQYAILMGLVHAAREAHPNKAIKFIVPPNCYGGTNDQTRRVAAAVPNVEVLDLPVDGGNDMAEGIDSILAKVAELDAVPYIIAEIPTNPRVEVPDLEKLRDALSKKRLTSSGETAVDPVFILDQTFCPNVRFLRDQDILADVRTIAFVSGSKFPSGGKCTAGYCVGNKKAGALIENIETHLKLCDNAATPLQLAILAKQMPSMLERIAGAYKNTREFVNYIHEVLPEAKINFVSEELASEGFTPSVFSLDLPTKGETDAERETHKRVLNHKLIKMMITEIPKESKYCVSYGQLKGCYWTIPATSTQGTTKESDKDYIARVSVSPNLDLERHKQVFLKFVESM